MIASSPPSTGLVRDSRRDRDPDDGEADQGDPADSQGGQQQ